jgi:predicted nuclease with TOPRIM domain
MYFIPRLLNALDELDREVDMLREVENDLRNELSILNKERCQYYAENQRLRKALTEIYEDNTIPIRVLNKAGKALAGDDK